MLFSTTLSACATRVGVQIPAGNQTVAESEALIVPAAGGPAIVNVVERKYSNAVAQTVALFTAAAMPGQNYLKIQMFGPMESTLDRQNGLANRSVHAADLAREMRQALPGIAMRTSSLFLQNNYGPFGYAFGRSVTGDACLYGWQQLRARDHERTAMQNSGAIQIRARICDSETDERELLSVMYGYTITGTFSADTWNPYGTVRAVNSGIGEDGHPILPRDEQLSRATPARGQVFRSPDQAVRAQRIARPVSDATLQRPSRAAVEVPSPFSANTAAPGVENKVLVPSPRCNEGGVACN
ncbi:MAG TPA: cellulose biosynthesis protein BcsN [Mycoplana sp.]|nr:cellulose biosynthesis protein BcsN [Mycoplana sp.]